MICRSSWISTQKRTPSGVAAPDGVFLLVLTALAKQTVKPLAQVIGYYLCSDRLKKCDDSVHGLPPPFRDWGIGEGPQCQYNTSSDPIQQKAPGTANTGGFLLVLTALLRTPQFLHCRAAAHPCAAHHSIHHRAFAFSMIHSEFGKLSAIQQKNVQNVQSLPSWQSLKSSCFRQKPSVCQIIQVIITLESAKAGKLRCCQRHLLILITVIGNHVLFLHA